MRGRIVDVGMESDAVSTSGHVEGGTRPGRTCKKPKDHESRSDVEETIHLFFYYIYQSLFSKGSCFEKICKQGDSNYFASVVCAE